MIVRYLPNGCKKISNLLSLTRSMSAVTDSASSNQSALEEMLNPANQLSKLQSTPIIEEPTSTLDSILYAYQTTLDSFQVTSGIPWWGIIVGVGVVGRLVTLPVHVQLEKRLVDKLPLITLEQESLIAKLKGDLVLSVKKKEEADAYRKTHGLSRSLKLLGYFLPGLSIFALNTAALYSLTTMNYAPLLNTSFLWMQSLCLPDPHRLLSFTNGVMIAMITKRYIQNTPYSELLQLIATHKKKSILLTLGLIGAQASLPSSILIYWTTSNITRLLVVEQLLSLDRFRTTAGLMKSTEKQQAFDSIPKSADTKLETIKFGGNSSALAIDPDSIRERELLSLWEDKDLGSLRNNIEEQKQKQSESTVLLEEDLDYCKDQIKNMSLKNKFQDPIYIQLTTQQQVLKDKIKEVEKNRSRLNTLERKVAIAERKESFKYILSEEMEDEYKKLKSDLLETHSNLLDELEECETEMSEEVLSKKLEYHERYTKRQELLKLQKSLIEDIEYCEKEILQLSSVEVSEAN